MFQSWSSVKSYSNDGKNKQIIEETSYQDNLNKNGTVKKLKHGLKKNKNLSNKEEDEMFYKIYKDDKKSKKLLGKSKNNSDWKLLEHNSNIEKNYSEKYEKYSNYFNKFKIDNAIKNEKQNKLPDMKIIKNKDNTDITYEINNDKDIKNINLFNDNVKNILNFKDLETIFNDPFFK